MRLDPHIPADRAKYNDDEVRQFFSMYPVAATDTLVCLPNDGRPGFVNVLPIQYLCLFRPSLETVQLIYKEHKDGIKSVDSNGWTVLHMSILQKQPPEILHFIIDVYPEAARSVSTKELWTPVHLVCENKSSDVSVAKKLARVAPEMLAHKTIEGITPLHAVLGWKDQSDKQLQMVDALVDSYPLCVVIPDTKNLTPRRMAKAYKCPKTLQDKLRLAHLIAVRQDRTYRTRFELEQVIRELQGWIDEAVDSKTEKSVETFDRAAMASVVIKDLRSRRRDLPSTDEIQAEIQTRTEYRDVAATRGDHLKAQQHQESIERLKSRHEKEIEAKSRAIASSESTDYSSQLVTDAVSCTGAWKAVPLTLSYILPCTDYLANRIGKGVYGDVYRGIDTCRGNCFAVKVIHKDKLGGKHGATLRRLIAREIEVGRVAVNFCLFHFVDVVLLLLQGMAKLDHPNVVRLLGYHLSEDPNEEQCLVYEMMGLSLWDHVNGQKKLGMATRIRIATNLVSVLAYLHSRNHFHRDIKPGNICLSEDLEKAYVVDFRTALFLNDDVLVPTETVATTSSRFYTAPEYLSSGRFGPECDVFSLGVVMKALISCTLPDYEDEPYYSSGLSFPDLERGDDCETAVIREFMLLAEKCVDPDPSRRPQLSWLHKFLASLDWRNQSKIRDHDQSLVDTILSRTRDRYGPPTDLSASGVCSCGNTVLEGLACSQDSNAHFCCNVCFREHVLDSHGAVEIRCREPGCTNIYSPENIFRHAGHQPLIRHFGLQISCNHGQRDSYKQQKGDIPAVEAASLWGVMRDLGFIGSDELDSPVLCLVVPAHRIRGKPSFPKMVRSLQSKTLLLYFVCAYSKLPVNPPVIVRQSQHWLEHVAPVVKATIVFMKLALAANQGLASMQIPVTGDFAKDQLRLLDEVFSTFLMEDDGDAGSIEEYIRCACEGNQAAVMRPKALAKEKLKRAFAKIEDVADDDMEWQNSMKLCTNRSGRLGWVDKRHVRKWGATEDNRFYFTNL